MTIILDVLCLAFVLSVNADQIYRQYWPQAKQVVQQMNLDQKIGQMSQADAPLLTVNGKTDPSIILKYNLGSVLVGGNSCPDNNGNILTNPQPSDYFMATMQNWQKFTQQIMLDVGLLAGTDAVHGNQHITGVPLFPQNIGIAASRNPQHFINEAYWTTQSVQQSGFNYIFAPTVAVSHNPQWGRFYETMGYNESLIYNYAQVFVTQAQSMQQGKITGVLTSTKHYMGDGATFNGYDEGDDRVYNFTTFYNKNIGGFRGGIQAQTGSIMCSFSAINGIPNGINPNLLIDKLKNKEGFDGFVISDYDEIGNVANQGLPTSVIKMAPKDAVCMIINAGVDMMMLTAAQSDSISSYQSYLKECIQNNNVSMSRIDDAVTRIIAVKMAMNLVLNETSKTKVGSKTNQEKVGQQQQSQQREIPQPKYSVNPTIDALNAAQESFVLLKNQAILPLQSNQIKYVIFIGERIINEQVNYLFRQNILYQDYDNIGSQNGGWTVRWQGFIGNKFWAGNLKNTSNATSILDAFRLQMPNAQLLYPQYSNVKDMNQVQKDRDAFISKLQSLQSQITTSNAVIIGTFAESPYAEYMGDVNCVYCYNTTASDTGCLYNRHVNDYMPLVQSTTLQIDLDSFENQILGMFKSVSLVSILLSGRPLLIQNILNQSQAFIAAWLPGTQGGQALVNSLFGTYLFKQNPNANTLPCDWPSNMNSLQNFPVYNPNGEVPKIANPLFTQGYGLSTTNSSSQESQQKQEQTSLREWIHILKNRIDNQ